MGPKGKSAVGQAKVAAPTKDAEPQMDQAMLDAREKLKERFGVAQGDANRVGGKGSQRRKKVNTRTAMKDDKKLELTLKRMNLAQIPAIEEVMMFKKNNTVLRFESPKVQGSPASNTYVITGMPTEKKWEDLLGSKISPEILEQLKKMNFDDMSFADPVSGAATATAGGSSAAVAGEVTDADKADGAAVPAANVGPKESSSDNSDDSDDSDAPADFEAAAK